MAWEWVAAVSAISGGVVGLGGLAVAYKSGEAQRTTALEVVRQQTETQIRIAREARVFEQRRVAYESTLRYLARFTVDWSREIAPWVWERPMPEGHAEPPLPPEDAPNEEQRSADLHWSKEVNEMLLRFAHTVNEVVRRARDPWFFNSTGQTAGADMARGYLEQGIGLMRAEANGVRDQMARELYGDEPPPSVGS